MFKKLWIKLVALYGNIRYYFVIRSVENDIYKETGIKVKIRFKHKDQPLEPGQMAWPTETARTDKDVVH